MRNEINGMNDVLETVSVLRTVKNFFFFLSVLSLIILGTIFVFSRIDMVEYPWTADAGKACCMQTQPQSRDIEIPALAAEVIVTPVEKQKPEQPKAEVQITEPETKESDVEQIKDQAEDAVAAIETTELKVDDPQSEPPAYDAQAGLDTAKWRVGWKQASVLIRLCNVALIFSLTMYCFTLLIGVKITLVGRLGGAYYITSAMFMSMFALVFFMPWQTAFPGAGIAGAMYLPYEFACAAMTYADLSKFDACVFYARYAGLWVIVTLALVMAQGRSMCWVARCLGSKQQ